MERVARGSLEAIDEELDGAILVKNSGKVKLPQQEPTMFRFTIPVRQSLNTAIVCESAELGGDGSMAICDVPIGIRVGG